MVRIEKTGKGYRPIVRVHRSGVWFHEPLKAYFPTEGEARAYGERYLKGGYDDGSTDTRAETRSGD